MPLVLEQTTDAVRTLTLNRADKLNALNREMYQALTAGFRDATADNSVRAIVIAGQAGIFTAGNDIGDFAAAAAEPERRDNPALELMKAILDTDKPIVAGVDGPAIGIGTTLLFHCDLVYATEQARFHTPFAALGVCPEFGSSITFSALMGHHRAAEMLLLCEPLNAQKGYEYGFVNEIVDSEALTRKLEETAARLAALPEQALRVSRQMIHRNKSIYLDIIEAESAQFGALMRSDEFRQNMQKFMQK
jgi:enoyl-CoA hydratase/carnithine racemase